MAIRVGINGFGRIGRNVLRACLGDDRTSSSSPSTTSPTRRRSRTCSSTTRSTARSPSDVTPTRTALTVDGKRASRSSPSAIPAKLPWKELGVDIVLECTGLFTDRDKAAKHLEAGAKKVHHLRAREGRRPHDLLRRQPHRLRSRQARRHLERVVHHQLPGAGRQGAARDLRHQARPDDHDPLLHQRPAHPRPAAQGPAPRARRGALDDPDHAPAPPRPIGAGAARSSKASSTAWRSACRRRTSRSSTSPPSSRSRPPRTTINAAMKEAADGPLKGILALLRRAARLDRLQRQPALVDLRRGADQRDRRQLRQGPRPGTTTSGASRTAWATSPSLIGATALKLRRGSHDAPLHRAARPVAGKRVFIRVDFNVPARRRRDHRRHAHRARRCRRSAA